MRHSYDGVKRSETPAKVFVTTPLNNYPPEVRVSLPGGTLWLSLAEAAALADKLRTATEGTPDNEQGESK